jgi:hypothetical protein
MARLQCDTPLVGFGCTCEEGARSMLFLHEIFVGVCERGSGKKEGRQVGRQASKQSKQKQAMGWNQEDATVPITNWKIPWYKPPFVCFQRFFQQLCQCDLFVAKVMYSSMSWPTLAHKQQNGCKLLPTIQYPKVPPDRSTLHY